MKAGILPPGSLQSTLVFIGVAFGLNLLWEMGQATLYADMAGLPVLEASRRCVLASLGDVAIIAASLFVPAALAWRIPLSLPRRVGDTILFAFIAFSLSILIERHALFTGRWRYGSDMPIVPWLEIGLGPMVQWLIIPCLSVQITLGIIRLLK